jgi:predicted LPLAT superfamily acyltransferase
MAQWGKSRGNALGYKIFIFLIRHAGVQSAYALLRLVTVYYLFFPGKAGASLKYYFSKRLGYSSIKTIWSIYENFNYLGKSIIDKVVMMSQEKIPFTIQHDGITHLEDMVKLGQGGLLISAHVGNWEAAGHLLKRLHTVINIVMYDGEQEQIKKYMDEVRERSFNVIFIKDDMSHIFAIREALARNEFVCIHADRYLEGTKTIESQLLGATVQLPLGPFVLATTFRMPVTFVFAMKETHTHYHFFATPYRIYSQSKLDLPVIVSDYLKEVENRLETYPLQWHNYFPFWEEEKSKN